MLLVLRECHIDALTSWPSKATTLILCHHLPPFATTGREEVFSLFHSTSSSPAVFLLPNVSLNALELLQSMSPSRPHLRLARFSASPIYLPPEIHHLIANYFTGADLAACVRVSKDWNAIFSPLLYMSLDLNAFYRVQHWELFDP